MKVEGICGVDGPKVAGITVLGMALSMSGICAALGTRLG